MVLFRGWWLFGKKKTGKLTRSSLFILLGIFLFSISLGVLGFINANEYAHSYLTAGLVGNNIAKLFVDFLGKIGASIVVLATWLILIRGYFSWNYYDVFNKLIGDRYRTWRKHHKAQKQEIFY